MRWVVLPVAIRAVSVATIHPAISVVVVYIGVVAVDNDIVIPTPTGIPAPATTKRSAHCHSHSKGKQHASRGIRRISHGWISNDWRSVDHGGVITRNIDHFGACLLDDNYTLVLDYLGFNLLLLGGLQRAFICCFLAHTLNGVHYFILLCQEGVSQIICPLDVVGQLLHGITEGSHGLNAWVPVLFHDGISQGFVLEIFILLQKLLKRDNLQRIGAGDQCLAEQRIGIERNRSDKRIELVGRELGVLIGLIGGGLRLLLVLDCGGKRISGDHE